MKNKKKIIIYGVYDMSGGANSEITSRAVLVGL